MAQFQQTTGCCALSGRDHLPGAWLALQLCLILVAGKPRQEAQGQQGQPARQVRYMPELTGAAGATLQASELTWL